MLVGSLLQHPVIAQGTRENPPPPRKPGDEINILLLGMIQQIETHPEPLFPMIPTMNQILYK
jgi:hypothetical protein